MEIPAGKIFRQHLIDPELCIRCHTCESTCPSGAITHDSRNYVVDADKCTLCLACIEPCPTGAIDGWRTMPRARVYSAQAQLGWDALPDELTVAELAAEGIAAGAETAVAPAALIPAAGAAPETALDGMQYTAPRSRRGRRRMPIRSCPTQVIRSPPRW